MPTRDPQQDISMSSAVLVDGNITVTFTRPLASNDSTRDIALTNNATNCVYFLIARGTSNVAARTIAQHSATNRFVSMERVCLCGRARVVPTVVPSVTPSVMPGGAGVVASECQSKISIQS